MTVGRFTPETTRLDDAARAGWLYYVAGNTQDEIARFDAKLSNEQFVAKAPEDVLAEQREKRAEAAALAVRLTDAIGRLKN